VPAVPSHADPGYQGDEQNRKDCCAALLTSLLPLRGAAVDRHPRERRGKSVNTV
jgi:hypothetical protein